MDIRTALLALACAVVVPLTAAEPSDPCVELFRDLGGGAGGNSEGGRDHGDASAGQGGNPIRLGADRRPVYGPPPRDCADRNDCPDTGESENGH